CFSYIFRHKTTTFYLFYINLYELKPFSISILHRIFGMPIQTFDIYKILEQLNKSIYKHTTATIGTG
ncbi:MAG: hypothetical protein IJC57_01695, partial [Clostridia bacterium]|nr:hypothetical protein [Clostridia bacterium]